MATTGELLNIEPHELQFPCNYQLLPFYFPLFDEIRFNLISNLAYFLLLGEFLFFGGGNKKVDLRKQISCSLRLINKGDNYVGFKVKTTNPKKYCVRPNTGVVLPRSTCDVTVTMQAQKEAPLDMQCKDKFLVQCILASAGATAKDLNSDMFTKESGNQVEECKLRVLYVAPPRPPSPVREDSEEGSPRPSVSDNDNFSASEFATGSGHKFEQPRFDAEDNSSEARTLVYKLTEEKNSAIQQNNKLRQELELLKRKGRSGGGIPLLYVLVGLIGIMLGYLMKSS